MCWRSSGLSARWGRGGPEAAARTARYARWTPPATEPVLLGHTLDDQAETVLLGLAAVRGRVRSPGCVLTTRLVPAAAGGAPRRDARRLHGAGTDAWQDPHNTDPPFHPDAAAPEVLQCWRTCSAAASPRRWPGPPTALREDTELIDVADRAGDDRGRCRPRGSRRRLGGAARPGAARRHPWLAARRRRERADRQADPRRGPARHRLAGQGGVAVGPLRNQRLFAGRRDGVLTLRRSRVSLNRVWSSAR